MLISDVIGERHIEMPFTVGWVGDRAQGYVHVFDDTTLDVVLTTLDTITDFVLYLEKKERLFSNTRISAAGEEELLAYYLTNLNSEGHHDFVFPPGYDAISLTEGHWKEFLTSSERAAQAEADEVSYFWDWLIVKFSRHIMQGTQYWASPSGIGEQEKILRFMAREPRTRRRMLSKALLDRVSNVPTGHRAVRVLLPSNKGDPHYVFLAFPWPTGISEDDYRMARRNLLADYCAVVKLEHQDAENIVGIATEAGSDARYRSEDAIYYDATNWTEEEDAEARKVQQELGLLKQVKIHRFTEQEYPSKIPNSSLGFSRTLAVRAAAGSVTKGAVARTCRSGTRSPQILGLYDPHNLRLSMAAPRST